MATTPGGVRRTTVLLRWVNPKVSRLKVVEDKTSFQHLSAASDSAGGNNVVVYWDEPEQRDTSRVTFRVALERYAEEIHYTPTSTADPVALVKYREQFSPIPTLDPPSRGSTLAPALTASAEEGVPPDGEEVASDTPWNPSCPRCEEMEEMCGICLSRANASS